MASCCPPQPVPADSSLESITNDALPFEIKADPLGVPVGEVGVAGSTKKSTGPELTVEFEAVTAAVAVSVLGCTTVLALKVRFVVVAALGYVTESAALGDVLF